MGLLPRLHASAARSRFRAGAACGGFTPPAVRSRFYREIDYGHTGWAV